MKTIFGISTLLLIVGAMVTGCGGGSGSSSAAASCNSSTYNSLQSVNGQNVCCMSGVTASTYSAYGAASSGCVLQSAIASGNTTQTCQMSGGSVISLGGGTYGCCPAGFNPYSYPLSTVVSTCPAVSTTGLNGYGVGGVGVGGVFIP